VAGKAYGQSQGRKAATKNRLLFAYAPARLPWLRRFFVSWWSATSVRHQPRFNFSISPRTMQLALKVSF